MCRNPLALLTSFLITALFVPAHLRAQEQQDSEQTPEKHQGTAPRASAAKYHSYAEKDGLRIGAELLTRKEVSDAFAADVNRCCLVVQVAIYPAKDRPIEISLTDFTLLEVGTDKPMRPESPTVVAAKLEKKKNPDHGVDVYPTASVGFESGVYVDPVTGQPVHVHGVSTSAGVGVGTGNTVPPEVTNHDREIMEWELSEKGLPIDKASVPVAGYLYFLIPKPNKDAKYRLEYAGEDKPLVLSLP